jgi:chromosome segregation ATPase
VRRIINTTKPLNVVEAKKEADRLNNLAKSAEVALSVTKEQQQQVEKDIEALHFLKKEIEEEVELEKEKIKETKKEHSLLKEKKTLTSEDVKKLEEEKEQKLSEISSVQKTVDKTFEEATLKAQTELDKKNKEIARLNDVSESLSDNVVRLVALKNAAIEDTEKEKVNLASLQEESLKLEKSISSSSIEEENILDQLKQLKEELETLQPLKDELDKTKKQVESAVDVLSELDTKIFERQMEYDSFDEKAKVTKENLKKIEEAIDVKTRRLKAMLEEKAVDKYLQMNDII